MTCNSIEDSPEVIHFTLVTLREFIKPHFTFLMALSGHSGKITNNNLSYYVRYRILIILFSCIP